MKQRIEELVNQSKFFANDERRYLERVHNREYSQDEWQDICFEKFAELILIEVTDILSTYSGKVVFTDGAEYNYQHPIIAIRKHFGVEE